MIYPKFQRCPVCWTHSWVPVTNVDPDAQELADGTGYVRCDYCWIQNNARRISRELEDSKQAHKAWIDDRYAVCEDRERAYRERDEARAEAALWKERSTTSARDSAAYEAEVERLRIARDKAEERIARLHGDYLESMNQYEEDLRKAWNESDRFRYALQSIALNTCCDDCSEAAFVARRALNTDQHNVECNADRSKPIGCDMCICVPPGRK